MPVYDYRCQTHGVFSDLATMSKSAEPAPCPVCAQLSARVIMMSSQLLDMAPANRQAHSRNEQARERPQFSTPESRAEDKARREHRHGKGCGCGDKPIRQSHVIYTADGSKVFPSARPWMISH
ncbi:zinc ribbon domain-containing protein [Gilvimarinus algae]|uniref:Zinc ribbon domain-containing protein n=1 Tax=Gilvimarinus algae TaxID=3058037 RepID=A0ABT8TE31_9GAMM|nr:zinc ribbon domain-containing protein [Gilvimarinus sp. SDUM040014]MDO3381880.1 zinc ribbon domain-containing protein [Gilvimarinus sp. SDUM040014]